MTRLILRFLNTPILLILTVFCLAIQTSLFGLHPLTYIQPDLVIILTVWFALRRDFLEGGILTLIIAEVAEVHSASIRGMLLVLYMGVFLVTRAASKYFLINNLTFLVVMTLIMTWAMKVASHIILSTLGLTLAPWHETLFHTLLTMTTNGLFGYWIYQMLGRFDWITFKDPRAREMLEDEIQTAGEGL